uniref:Protein kinase domain-containing protein n=1 Tax=Globodera rostochiensis TaxID=31243 RepID=A0A914H6N9_GLORO
MALGQGSPLLGQSFKFPVQNKPSQTNFALNVPNRRFLSSHASMEISPNEPVKSVEKKKELELPRSQTFSPKVGSDFTTISSSSTIPQYFKCDFNEYLAAVVEAHGFYYNVPQKTIAKIALKVISASASILSEKHSDHSDQAVFDEILTFNHFSVMRENEFEFGAAELSGDFKIELIDSVEKVGDPRERTLPADQKSNRPIIWLKDLLFMSPEQIKEGRKTYEAKDLVWFVGLLLYRMLFNNRHPMDSWEPKRLLDLAFLAKTDYEMKPYQYKFKWDDLDYAFKPLKPTNRWMWMPETARDETGEMATVEARIGIEQAYVNKLRSLVANSLENNHQMLFNYSRFAAEHDEQDKLIELTMLCLHSFPEHRTSLSLLSEVLEQMEN